MLLSESEAVIEHPLYQVTYTFSKLLLLSKTWKTFFFQLYYLLKLSLFKIKGFFIKLIQKIIQYMRESNMCLLASELINLLSFAFDSTTDQVSFNKLIGGALNDELLLVLCHHFDPQVRASTVALLHIYLIR